MPTRTSHENLYSKLVANPEWNVLSNEEMERLKNLISGNG